MTRGNEIVIGGTTVRPGQRVDMRALEIFRDHCRA